MHVRILVIALLMCVQAGANATSFMTASKFMSLMPAFDRGIQRNSSTDDQADGIQAVAYLMGVHDLGRSILFCPPQNADATQLLAVARKYMADKPERWNERASTLISESFSRAFPCEK